MYSSNKFSIKNFDLGLSSCLATCVFCKEFKFVHILPFFPYSYDDGFAVKDYKRINPEHGSWDDFKLIALSFNVMIDLVIN